MTPFTYEGMLDNFYDIHLNQIMVPSEIVDANSGSNSEKNIGTNKSSLTRYLLYNPLDDVYSDLTSMSIYSME